MTIRYGMLDRSLVVERSSEMIEADGTPTFTWTELHRLRAAVLEESMAEEQDEHGSSSIETIRFRVPFVSDLTLADRVVYAEQNYDIRSVKPIFRRRGLELTCRKSGG